MGINVLGIQPVSDDRVDFAVVYLDLFDPDFVDAWSWVSNPKRDRRSKLIAYHDDLQVQAHRRQIGLVVAPSDGGYRDATNLACREVNLIEVGDKSLYSVVGDVLKPSADSSRAFVDQMFGWKDRFDDNIRLAIARAVFGFSVLDDQLLYKRMHDGTYIPADPAEEAQQTPETAEV